MPACNLAAFAYMVAINMPCVHIFFTIFFDNASHEHEPVSCPCAGLKLCPTIKYLLATPLMRCIALIFTLTLKSEEIYQQYASCDIEL